MEKSMRKEEAKKGFFDKVKDVFTNSNVKKLDKMGKTRHGADKKKAK